jgi:hypothetical protein
MLTKKLSKNTHCEYCIKTIKIDYNSNNDIIKHESSFKLSRDALKKYI